MRAVVILFAVMLTGCAAPSHRQPADAGTRASEPNGTDLSTRVLGRLNVSWAGTGQGQIAFEVPAGVADLGWAAWGENATAHYGMTIRMEGCPDGVNPLSAGEGPMGGSGWATSWCKDPPAGKQTADVQMQAGVLIGRVCVYVVGKESPAFLC